MQHEMIALAPIPAPVPAPAPAVCQSNSTAHRPERPNHSETATMIRRCQARRKTKRGVPYNNSNNNKGILRRQRLLRTVAYFVSLGHYVRSASLLVADATAISHVVRGTEGVTPDVEGSTEGATGRRHGVESQSHSSWPPGGEDGPLLRSLTPPSPQQQQQQQEQEDRRRKGKIIGERFRSSFQKERSSSVLNYSKNLREIFVRLREIKTEARLNVNASGIFFSVPEHMDYYWKEVVFPPPPRHASFARGVAAIIVVHPP